MQLQETDAEKTTFRTHHSHFEFQVISFRLTNAPSTCQALMIKKICHGILVCNNNNKSHQSQLFRVAYMNISLPCYSIKSQKLNEPRTNISSKVSTKHVLGRSLLWSSTWSASTILTGASTRHPWTCPYHLKWFSLITNRHHS